jgi:hypothetical protein
MSLSEFTKLSSSPLRTQAFDVPKEDLHFLIFQLWLHPPAPPSLDLDLPFFFSGFFGG